MPSSLPQQAQNGHAKLFDGLRPRAAKVSVKPIDMEWTRTVGQMVGRAVTAAGLSMKEAAARIGVEPAELSRWLSGERRAHLDRLLAVPEIRHQLAKQIAQIDGGRLEERIVWPGGVA